MPSDAPRLVIFDVDGTLHDAAQWWPELIRRGVVEFSKISGLLLEEPDDRKALSVVGAKAEGVWQPFMPENDRDRWEELRALVLPLECDELRSGRDHLFAGIRDLLVELRRLGVSTALASNCGADYMAAIKEGQGLQALTDHQYCLASEGVTTKTDMLRLAMAACGRTAAETVMVGDRENDHVAAREAGVAFVWRVNDLCDIPDADHRWDGDPGRLLALLGLSGDSGLS